jgi:hypothetical protein
MYEILEISYHCSGWMAAGSPGMTAVANLEVVVAFDVVAELGVVVALEKVVLGLGCLDQVD